MAITRLVLLAAFLVACPADQDGGPGESAVDELVSTAWLAERLDDPAVVVLHVGAAGPEGYEEAHVPGARFLSFEAIVDEQGEVPNALPSPAAAAEAFEGVGVSDESVVVLYGEGEGILAGRAFFTLDWLGHKSHALLNGGLEAWQAEERPVDTGRPGVERGDLTPDPRPGLVVDAEWILERLDDPEVILLDARSPEAFAAGHLPGARSYHWRRPLGAAVPRLEDPGVVRTELRELTASAETVVAYCNTGIMSSYLYVLARMADLEPKLYDGSMDDWKARGLPTETGALHRLRRW